MKWTSFFFRVRKEVERLENLIAKVISKRDSLIRKSTTNIFNGTEKPRN